MLQTLQEREIRELLENINEENIEIIIKEFKKIKDYIKILSDKNILLRLENDRLKEKENN